MHSNYPGRRGRSTTLLAWAASAALLSSLVACAATTAMVAQTTAAVPAPGAASAPAVHGARGAPSTSVAFSGALKQPMSLDVAALRALPAATLAIGTNSYTGADLWTLLDGTLGLKTDPAAMNGNITLAVVATGSDGYKAVLSLAEIDPDFGHRPVLVAYGQNGAGLGRSGEIRLIVGGDAKMGRSVSNLVSISVIAIGK